jgi:hypothetical protein
VDVLVAASVQTGDWPAIRRRLNAMIVVAVGPVTAEALAPMMRELAARVAPGRGGRGLEQLAPR